MDLDHLVPDKGALLARHEFFRGVSGEVMRKLTAHARPDRLSGRSHDIR